MEKIKDLYTVMFTEYPDLVDVAQLQTMLKINRHTAYDLISSGELRAARVGRKFRIPKISVIEYIFRDGNPDGRRVG